jgi:hypothetical protein
MTLPLNLIGQRFGRLVVVSDERIHGKRASLCQCDCGKTRIALNAKLRNGLISSCGCTKKKPGPVTPRLEGLVFGEYTVIEMVSTGKAGAKWKVVCSCGTSRVLTTTILLKGRQRRCSFCNTGVFRPKGHEEITGTYWCSIVCGAERRALECSITIEFIWNLFLKQDRKCALSGDHLTLGPRQTASLDRIDSSRGYAVDNVQWVHKDINRMKSVFTEECFIDWCQKVVHNRTTAS